MYDITLSIVFIVAVMFFAWAIILQLQQSRRGEGPNDDRSRKPFLDRKGNHSYYDRKLMQ